LNKEWCHCHIGRTKEPKWNEDFVFNIKLPPAKKIEVKMFQLLWPGELWIYRALLDFPKIVLMSFRLQLGMQTLLPRINVWGIPKSTWNPFVMVRI